MKWNDGSRSPASHRPSGLLGLAALVGALALTGCDSCKKKSEDALPPAPPPPGGASAEMVSTGLGSGLGLDAHLAPTSARWTGVVVVGDKGAVITGHTMDQAIALRTDDGGRSWRALKAPAEQSDIRWGTAEDGTIALALGQRAAGKKRGARGPIQSMTLAFAQPADAEMGAPIPLYPDGSAPKGATVAGDDALPATWPGPVAALLMTMGRSKPTMAYGAPAGTKLPTEPPALPAERFVAIPYGRPPSMVSAVGGSLRVRPWPLPGAPVDPSSPIPGSRAAALALTKLATAPRCDSGAWTFQVVPASARASNLVGVSPTRALAVKLPHGDARLLGCSPDAVVIQTMNPNAKQPALVRCTLDGKCASPKSPPFRYWTAKHERTLHATATSDGVVATMAAKAGARWGLYLGQSLNRGELFELPRVIGEGSSDRGYIEVGAVVSWPKRVLLLISADVTGTTRRGWYVIASDDQGTNWGLP